MARSVAVIAAAASQADGAGDAALPLKELAGRRLPGGVCLGDGSPGTGSCGTAGDSAARRRPAGRGSAPARRPSPARHAPDLLAGRRPARAAAVASRRSPVPATGPGAAARSRRAPRSPRPPSRAHRSPRLVTTAPSPGPSPRAPSRVVAAEERDAHGGVAQAVEQRPSSSRPRPVSRSASSSATTSPRRAATCRASTASAPAISANRTCCAWSGSGGADAPARGATKSSSARRCPSDSGAARPRPGPMSRHAAGHSRSASSCQGRRSPGCADVTSTTGRPAAPPRRRTPPRACVLPRPLAPRAASTGRAAGPRRADQPAERGQLGLTADEHRRAADDRRARRDGQRAVHVDPRVGEQDQVIGAGDDAVGRPGGPRPARRRAWPRAAVRLVGARPVVQRDQEGRPARRCRGRGGHADWAAQAGAGRLVRAARAERRRRQGPDQEVARVLQLDGAAGGTPRAVLPATGRRMARRPTAPAAAGQQPDGRGLVVVVPAALRPPASARENGTRRPCLPAWPGVARAPRRQGGNCLPCPYQEAHQNRCRTHAAHVAETTSGCVRHGPRRPRRRRKSPGGAPACRGRRPSAPAPCAVACAGRPAFRRSAARPARGW